MKVHTLKDLFLFGGLTREQHPYLAAGRHKQFEAAWFARIKALLDDFSVPPQCQPQTLDRLLAELLVPAEPQPFLLGCTIRVPGMAGPTGGILGSPGAPAQSASGAAESLPDGWKLLTFPGGPGLAYLEGPAGAFHPVIPETRGRELLLDLAKQACAGGVRSFVALTDGTGEEARGGAIIQYERDYCLQTLEEIRNINFL